MAMPLSKSTTIIANCIYGVCQCENDCTEHELDVDPVCGFNGITYSNKCQIVKESCFTNNNSVTTEEQLSCYNCEVTVDSLNRTIGFGNAACFENPQARHLDTCGNGKSDCKMVID